MYMVMGRWVAKHKVNCVFAFLLSNLMLERATASSQWAREADYQRVARKVIPISDMVNALAFYCVGFQRGLGITCPGGLGPMKCFVTGRRGLGAGGKETH